MVGLSELEYDPFPGQRATAFQSPLSIGMKLYAYDLSEPVTSAATLSCPVGAVRVKLTGARDVV